ncbi:carboxymuconolactone decarboxylase family protein [Taylorella asinigenitalis]|uniref:carboxymuconolactone decarboxylase family protein n=1 Tax=Taylorella asinigenitalis TaxID=84590 RepID=UPI0004904C90|nr:carboxymuconolactone decarboxylase family protein [Taylorella asinigenitalis]
MEFLTTLKDKIPDWAKDVRLNIDGTMARSSLSPVEVQGVAVSAAYALKNRYLVETFKEGLEESELNGVLTSASLMGMNNTYYPFAHLNDELANLPAKLRMNAYANSGGIEKGHFEIYGLAASIIGKCDHCIKAHINGAKEAGYTTEQIQDIGRITAVVNAIAGVLAITQAN